MCWRQLWRDRRTEKGTRTAQKGKRKNLKTSKKEEKKKNQEKKKGSFGSGFRFALGSRKVHTESHGGTYVCFTVAECTMCSFGLPKATQVMNGRA